MRDRALAWAIASRAGESAEAWLGGLPEERRERVRAEMGEDAAGPDARLAEMRAEEVAAIAKRAAAAFGPVWRQANPAVKRFLWARIPEDGEDS